MMSFGALKYFESVIKKLKKIIVLYQPHDLHLCIPSHTIRLPVAYTQLEQNKDNSTMSQNQHHCRSLTKSLSHSQVQLSRPLCIIFIHIIEY